VSEEIIFGLRKGDDSPPYLVIGQALNHFCASVQVYNKK